jgi:integrase
MRRRQSEGRGRRSPRSRSRSGECAPEEDWPAGQVRDVGATREATDNYLRTSNKKSSEFLFAGGQNLTITTRQYARLVSQWIASIGLNPSFFGTHSLRRTKATLIYRRTGNLRAVQLLPGHLTACRSTLTRLARKSPSRDRRAANRPHPRSAVPIAV